MLNIEIAEDRSILEKEKPIEAKILKVLEQIEINTRK